MHRVILVGSPRPGGRSAHLADELFNACIEECPEDGVSIVSVASADVSPCCACDACAHVSDELSAAMEEGDPLTPCRFVSESDAAAHRCVIADDMPEVRKHLDAADELMVVAPVYFSGSCAQMKALLDRMQPYFWSNARRMGKRPMVLHVVGEGGDPHGFEPLIGEVRSAFGVAGFELELVLDWVGKIDAQGEIFAEADEYPIPPKGGFASLELPGGFEFAEADDADDAEAADAASVGATDETDGAGGGRCDFDGSGAALHREPAEETRFAKKGKPSLSLSDAQPQGKKQAKGRGAAQGGSGSSRGKGGGQRDRGGKSQGAGRGKGGKPQGVSRGSGKGRSGQGGKRHG